MTAIIGIRYRNYTHYILYRSCLPIYGIAIIFFMMILKDKVTFLLLSNPVLQYTLGSGHSLVFCLCTHILYVIAKDFNGYTAITVVMSLSTFFSIAKIFRQNSLAFVQIFFIAK